MLISKTAAEELLAAAAAARARQEAQRTSIWARFLNRPPLSRTVSLILVAGVSILAWAMMYRLLRLLIG